MSANIEDSVENCVAQNGEKIEKNAAQNTLVCLKKSEMLNFEAQKSQKKQKPNGSAISETKS